jgi:hypothetical protein
MLPRPSLLMPITILPMGDCNGLHQTNSPSSSHSERSVTLLIGSPRRQRPKDIEAKEHTP